MLYIGVDLGTSAVKLLLMDENGTIHKFFLDYRLEIASELLINEKISVKEISYKCGFEDPNYFCKVFRKKYNKSPLEFKNERT